MKQAISIELKELYWIKISDKSCRLVNSAVSRVAFFWFSWCGGGVLVLAREVFGVLGAEAGVHTGI
jgi:hypothetical protein